MRMRVGPKNVGQNDGIARIRLGSTRPVPIAIAGDGKWIDGVHPATGSEQSGHQEQVRALDGDRHRLINAFATLSEHAQKVGETCSVDAYPLYGEEVARFIDDSDIMVVFGPIDPARQAHGDPPLEAHIESIDWAPAA
jgi:hypothetical protein